jgi:4-carboxymuconolactone decarboxylase
MRTLRLVVVLLLVLGGGLIGHAFAQNAVPTPAGIYPDSRNRLPLVRRDDLDESGKKMYDQTAGDSRSLAGLQGPGGIRLYDPQLDALTRGVNQYLRFNAGLDPRLLELAILVSAREMDQRFEWYAHEAAGLKEGLQPEIIDVVRYRKPVAGLGEKEATIIELGREALGKHSVSPTTFAEGLRLFGKKQLLDYVELMGSYAETSVLLTTYDQQLPPGQVSKLPVR